MAQGSCPPEHLHTPHFIIPSQIIPIERRHGRVRGRSGQVVVLIGRVGSCCCCPRAPRADRGDVLLRGGAGRRRRDAMVAGRRRDAAGGEQVGRSGVRPAPPLERVDVQSGIERVVGVSALNEHRAGGAARGATSGGGSRDGRGLEPRGLGGCVANAVHIPAAGGEGVLVQRRQSIAKLDVPKLELARKTLNKKLLQDLTTYISVGSNSAPYHRDRF